MRTIGLLFQAVRRSHILLTNAAGSPPPPAPAPGGATPAPTLTGSPTLIASWDFGNSAKITQSGGLISAIAPSDGAGPTLSQATGGSQPSAVTVAGYGAAYFQGNHLLFANNGLGRSTTDFISVVAVMEMAATGTAGTVFSLANGSGSSNYARDRLQVAATTSGYQYRQGDNTNNTVASFGTAYPLGRHLVVGTGAASGNPVKIYKDSATSPGSITSTLAAKAAAPNRVAIGADQSADFLSGYVWRILVYAGTLSSTNITELATWANAAWGIGTTSSSIGSITTSWELPLDMTNVSTQKIYWSLNYGGTDFSATIADNTTTTYTITGLTTGTWHAMHRTVSAGGVESGDVYLGSKDVA